MQGRHLVIIFAAVVGLSACGGPESATQEQAAPTIPATRISVHTAARATIEVTDSTVGWVDSKSAPALTAEVSGRVTRILVDAGDQVQQGQLLAEIDPTAYRLARDAAAADVQRLQALVENQQRQVERNRRMLEENFIAEAMYEDSRSQLQALSEQLRGAQARLDNAERDLRNTRVLAPVSGVVDQRLITAGDFVAAGQPLLRLVSGQTLRVHLPFPETVAARLSPGLPVRLSTPLAPDEVVTGKIDELRPSLGRARAVEAIVDVQNPGSWRAGASVRGTVVLETRDNIVLPEAAVVLRPAGRTVYVIANGRATARLVEVGTMRDGQVEILSGLQPGELVALDGAGFLTDGALVSLQESAR